MIICLLFVRIGSWNGWQWGSWLQRLHIDKRKVLYEQLIVEGAAKSSRQHPIAIFGEYPMIGNMTSWFVSLWFVWEAPI